MQLLVTLGLITCGKLPHIASECLELSVHTAVYCSLQAGVLCLEHSSYSSILLVQVWRYMRALLKAATKKTGESSWDLTLHRSTSINPDLLPLLRGAWIVSATRKMQHTNANLLCMHSPFSHTCDLFLCFLIFCCTCTLAPILSST